MELYDSALEYFRALGIRTFRALVEKSNREALLFYHALECELQQDGEGNSIEVICSLE
jgi:L-amino acid N-acyltransferase YncA